MSTTRLSSGLAFAPHKELERFSRMAAKGKQLSGLGAAGHGWAFTDAAPEHAVFDMTHEADPSPGYFDIFAAAGWTLVLSVGGTHIFKAAPGTTPVHTSIESQRDELVRQRNQFALSSVIALALLAAVIALLLTVTLPGWVKLALLVVAPIPVVYTVMPLVGYMYQLRRLPASA